MSLVNGTSTQIRDSRVPLAGATHHHRVGLARSGGPHPWPVLRPRQPSKYQSHPGRRWMAIRRFPSLLRSTVRKRFVRDRVVQDSPLRLGTPRRRCELPGRAVPGGPLGPSLLPLWRRYHRLLFASVAVVLAVFAAVVHLKLAARIPSLRYGRGVWSVDWRGRAAARVHLNSHYTHPIHSAHGGFIILLSALASGSRIQRGLFTIAHRFLGCFPY